MDKVYSVDGYWKEDGEKFFNYLIAERDYTSAGYDDEAIFFYGFNEDSLNAAMKPDNGHDFVITDWREVLCATLTSI